MCKKRVEKDESASVQTTNLGLVNMESSSAGGMGVFEIVAVVMCVMCILLTCHYCNRRFRKRRQRELHDAVQGGLQGNVGFRTVSGAARGPMAGVPMVTFSDPGVRSVALTQSPSAPMLPVPALPAPKAAALPALPQGLNVSPAERIGLWEQCR